MIDLYLGGSRQSMIGLFYAARSFDEPVTHELLSTCLDHFDTYIRGYNRSEAVRQLSRTECLICGQGWEHLDPGTGPARFLGPVPSDELMGMFGRSKLVFNIVCYYYSCSERIFEALSMGTAVLSSRSAFLDAEFAEGGLWFCDRIAGDDDALLRVCEMDDDELAVSARAGRRIFLAGHTWEHRMWTMVDALASL